MVNIQSLAGEILSNTEKLAALPKNNRDSVLSLVPAVLDVLDRQAEVNQNSFLKALRACVERLPGPEDSNG